MSRGNQESVRSPEYQVLIDLLKEAWMNSGQTRKAICDKLGKPKNYLNKIEKGERRLDVVEVFRLCDAIGVEPMTLLTQFAKQVRSAAN